MKKVLLTGAFGGLGSAIQEVGAGQYEFVCADINVPDDRSEDPINVTDKRAVTAAAAGCDAIIHTAFYKTPQYARDEPSDNSEEYYRVNLIGADNCFQAALSHNIKRVVLSSSMEITIGAAWSTGGAAMLGEDAPYAFDHFYNLTKAQIELMASYYHRNTGIICPCLRYMAFDPVDKMAIGYGLLARSIWTHDAARASLLALESDRVTCEPINIGPKTPLTSEDIAESLGNYDAVVEKYFPGATTLLEGRVKKKYRPPLWPVARIDRARALLGWEPEWTFGDYLDAVRNERP